jgi:hypothetical protein
LPIYRNTEAPTGVALHGIAEAGLAERKKEVAAAASFPAAEKRHESAHTEIPSAYSDTLAQNPPANLREVLESLDSSAVLR